MTPDPDLERELAGLHQRAGSPADLRRRDTALKWLLLHSERAFPVALARAEATPGDLPLLDFIGRCRRPEATPFLIKAFAVLATRPLAAAGLGQSPDPAARQALHAALRSSRPGDPAAALAGLGAGGQTEVCPEVITRLHAADAELRWVAVDVGLRLGCIDEATRQTLARDDPDDAVRRRAAQP